MDLTTQPLVGFRRWNIAENGILHSVALQSPWSVGENIAWCRKMPASDHNSPGAGCFCGFNAWFEYQNAAREYNTRGTVIGAILAAGDMRIHEEGFRSEKAQILGLVSGIYEDHWVNQAVQKASEFYGFPLFDSEEDLIETAKFFGLYLPDYTPSDSRRNSFSSSSWQSLIWPPDSFNDSPSVVTEDGIQKWFQNGVLHREGDKPALIDSVNGIKEWWFKGERFRTGDHPTVVQKFEGRLVLEWRGGQGLHREGDKPARIVYDEWGNVCAQEWWQEDRLHRDRDRPAKISNRGMEWYQNGGRHRLGDLPSFVSLTRKGWYKNNKLHREGGLPAMEDNGDLLWALGGKIYREGGLPAVEKTDGCREWYNQEGKIHRDHDLPAKINSDGILFWFQNGVYHREGDKPAVENPDGSKVWWKQGIKHRLNGPALISADGRKEFWVEGKLHRDEDLPAVIHADGTQEWYSNGVKHRQGKPAIIRPDGFKEFWIQGNKIARQF